VIGGPGELPGPDPFARLQSRSEPPSPRTGAVLAGEAVREQQLQVAVVGSEHPVVERLLVVRGRAGPQQPLGERLPVRERRLAPNPLLATAETAGQGSERRRQPEPQEACVRVRASVEQGVRGSQDSVLGGRVGDHPGRGKDPRVGQVEQWGQSCGPPVRRAAAGSAARCALTSSTRAATAAAAIDERSRSFSRRRAALQREGASRSS
jgi:hypothetical protein